MLVSILFLLLTLFFASPLSLYRWEAPVTTVGDTVVTRQDVYDTFKILSMTTFLVTFGLVLFYEWKGRRS